MTDSLPIALTAPLSKAQKTSLINLVRRTARAEIMPRFRNLSHSDVSSKSGPYDLVTEADTAAEAMLARGLQQMFPHALVVGEEACGKTPELRDQIGDAEMAIILDPVDGTWNFAHGLPLFGVILSVTRFGNPVFGLLYDPVMDDWICADSENAAHLSRNVGADRPLSVARGGALSEMSGYVHLYLLPENKQAEMAACLPELARTLMLRCSCHEYRTLAQGGMDFMISGTLNPWDHAAGVLICQQAGGVVRMMDGADYNAGLTEGYILAAPNEDSWARLRDRFAFLMD